MIHDDVVKVLKELKNGPLSLREVAKKTKFTERECEILVPLILNEKYLVNIDEIIGPNTLLTISEEGLAFLEVAAPDYETAINSHLWYRVGSFGGDLASQVTKDKWYPMGSICKKCGTDSKKFKKNPRMCPKK